MTICIMDPVTWLHLIFWSVKVMILADFPASIHVETHWRSSGEIPFIWSGETKALELGFGMAGNPEISNTYLVLPYGDYSLQREALDSPAMQPELLGVTPFCIVYGMPVTFKAQSSTEEALSRRVDQMFRIHLNIQSYESTEIENGITLRGGIQVIRMEQFPYSVNLQIADPGSGSIEQVRAEFPGEMIHLTLIPDFGEINQRWIIGNSDPNRCQDQILSKLFPEIEKNLQEAASQDFFPEVEMYYLKAVDKVNELLANQPPHNECRSKLLNWVHRFFCQSRATNDYNEWDLFPDYQPKLGPDGVLDFRPALRDELEQLLDAKKENLPSLLRTFSNYQKLAGKNPGKWENGNMVLGAKAREYNPSDQELILAEIGKRILTVVKDLSQDQVRKSLRGLWLRRRNLHFIEFTFTHFDVMGSGRFFYVNKMEEQVLNFEK